MTPFMGGGSGIGDSFIHGVAWAAGVVLGIPLIFIILRPLNRSASGSSNRLLLEVLGVLVLSSLFSGANALCVVAAYGAFTILRGFPPVEEGARRFSILDLSAMIGAAGGSPIYFDYLYGTPYKELPWVMPVCAFALSLVIGFYGIMRLNAFGASKPFGRCLMLFAYPYIVYSAFYLSARTAWLVAGGGAFTGGEAQRLLATLGILVGAYFLVHYVRKCNLEEAPILAVSDVPAEGVLWPRGKPLSDIAPPKE